MTDFKVGDRVKVEFEGVVSNRDEHLVRVNYDADSAAWIQDSKVSKLDPKLKEIPDGSAFIFGTGGDPQYPYIKLTGNRLWSNITNRVTPLPPGSGDLEREVTVIENEEEN